MMLRLPTEDSELCCVAQKTAKVQRRRMLRQRYEQAKVPVQTVTVRCGYAHVIRQLADADKPFVLHQSVHELRAPHPSCLPSTTTDLLRLERPAGGGA
jgi:hypothetical protein